MCTSQCKHNEQRTWKKYVALFRLCLFYSGVKTLTVLIMTAYVFQLNHILLVSVCVCVCVCVCFRLAVETSVFKHIGPESVAINPHHLLLLVSPSSRSPSFPSSPLLQSSAEPPTCLQLRSRWQRWVCYLSSACYTTHTQTHTHRCILKQAYKNTHWSLRKNLSLWFNFLVLHAVFGCWKS